MTTVELAGVTEHTVVLPLLPQSNNTPSQRNRHGQDRAKKDWKDHVVMALHELDLPRRAFFDPPENPPTRLFVDATFYNPIKRGSHGFDVENLRDAFAKPFADAATGKAGSTPGMGQRRSVQDREDRAYWLRSGARIKCGWLVDDKDEHWTLRTRCVQHRGPAQTRVRLAWFDGPVPSEEAGWLALALLRGEADPDETRAFLGITC